MKVYISADIEGIAGISHWDEARPDQPAYAEFRERMTAHVAAACEGAVAGGATEILVKDAHAEARNIDAARLPECTRVVRGWSGHPLMMVQELEPDFAAAAMVGYHARAGSGGNPLAHTMSSSRIARLVLNGQTVSEFHLHAWAAAYVGVPVVFVSGDEALCEEVQALNPAIHTCAVLRGRGASTTSLHPRRAEEGIREGMRRALRGDIEACRLALPEHFELAMHYTQAALAFEKGFYPGAEQVDDHEVRLACDDYFEVMRAIAFLI